MFKVKVFLRSLLGEGVWATVQRLSPAPRHRLMRLVQKKTDRVVQGGPFTGVRYLHDAVSGCYIPKLLGLYERELHALVNSLQGYGIRQIVNVGASDGYYAVGFACRMPTTRVVAFEIEPRGQQFVRRIAEQNGVGSRVIVRGRCGISELQAAAEQSDRTLVFCDVEGFEDVLLDPEKVPTLARAWILVELHDGKNAGVSERIRRRFATTHEIETIWQERRAASEFPFSTAYTRNLPSDHLEAAVNEGRPVRDGIAPMSWFWMVPKTMVLGDC